MTSKIKTPSECGRRFLFRELGLNVNRALKSFLLNFTADLVRRANVSVEKVCISMTAAAAKELRPTSAALRLVEDVRLTKIFQPMPFILRHTVEDIAQPITLATNELMTRIKVAILRHGKIFVTGSATRKPLRDARTVV